MDLETERYYLESLGFTTQEINNILSSDIDNDGEQDTVAIVGDSILQGVHSIRNAIVRSYRGDTIEDITNHVKAGRANSIFNKKVVILHVGTNDVCTLEITQMLQDLKCLIQEVRYWLPEAIICYSGIIPRPRDYTDTQFQIWNFNTEVKRMSQFWNIRYLPTPRIFTRYGAPRYIMYRDDDLHPSDTGADRLGWYYAKYIARFREELGIPRMIRTATETEVTKKPRKGYKYFQERKRRRLFPRVKYGEEYIAVYAENRLPKETHKPRLGKKKRRRPKNRNALRHKRKRTKKQQKKNQPTSKKQHVPITQVQSVQADRRIIIDSSSSSTQIPLTHPTQDIRNVQMKRKRTTTRWS